MVRTIDAALAIEGILWDAQRGMDVDHWSSQKTMMFYQERMGKLRSQLLQEKKNKAASLISAKRARDVKQ